MLRTNAFTVTVVNAELRKIAGQPPTAYLAFDSAVTNPHALSNQARWVPGVLGARWLTVYEIELDLDANQAYTELAAQAIVRGACEELGLALEGQVLTIGW